MELKLPSNMEFIVPDNATEIIGELVEKMRNGKNILVIGNGFDLYHGIPTRYYDFVEFTKNPIVDNCNEKKGEMVLKICKENPFLTYLKSIVSSEKQWIDCEQEIAAVISVFSKLMSKATLPIADIYLSGKDCEIGLSFTDYVTFHKVNSEFKFKKWIEPDNAAFNKEGLLTNLKEKLNEVIFVLHYYLFKNCLDTPISKKSKQLESIVFDKVINFNYTYTYRHYGIDSDKIFFIHGKLDDFNTMVLGIDDYEQEDLNFIYFKKYFQRIQKKLGTIDSEWFKKPVSEDGIIADKVDKADRVCFFGHSMSNSDGDIIKDIFSRTQQVIIFFLNQGDYEQKIINLIDIFGKDKILKDTHSGFIRFVEIE